MSSATCAPGYRKLNGLWLIDIAGESHQDSMVQPIEPFDKAKANSFCGRGLRMEKKNESR
jgi:hypothetical protein